MVDRIVEEVVGLMGEKVVSCKVGVKALVGNLVTEVIQMAWVVKLVKDFNVLHLLEKSSSVSQVSLPLQGSEVPNLQQMDTVSLLF